MEIAHTVFLLDIHQFLLHQVEVFAETLHLVLVLARDVGFAQRHQVVNVITRIKQQTAHGAVGHLVLNQGNGAHVQPDQLLHIFHVLVERQAHLGKDLGHHFLAHEIMVMERPAQLRVPAFGACLAHIMQQCGPTEPYVITDSSHVVKHLQGVHEIVLMAAAVHGLDALERCQLGENERQQSALFQQHPAA